MKGLASMELQLIEVYIPTDRFEAFEKEIKAYEYIEKWHHQVSKQVQLVKIVLNKKQTEEILDFLEVNDDQTNELKVILYNISTYLPRIKQEVAPNEKEEENREIARASRHELYNVVQSSSRINLNYIWLLILSAIVATAGIVKDSAAIVIGAMVIAPLIGPFTAIAFSSILGDYQIIKKAVTTALLGLVIPISIAILFGVIFPLPSQSREFLARTNIELMDIVVAIAAGAAGALSFARRVSEALVGVMVSVALLPPSYCIRDDDWFCSV